MKQDIERLLTLTEKFQDQPVLVVGDLILDHYIWGEVNRISPEAPVVVVETTDESKRLGGAGNVAHNLITLGAKVSVFGIVGDDDHGRMFTSLLQDLGADVSGVLVDRTRPTTTKTRVIARGQQVVRVDHESKQSIASTYQHGIAVALRSRLESAKSVVISDYAKGVVCEPIFECIEAGYQKGVLGFGKIPIVVDPKAPNFSLYSRATVVKPNRKEAEMASGMSIATREDAVKAARVIFNNWNSESLLITLGEQGMVLVSRVNGKEQISAIETVAQEVFDVSGAGDTVSATLAAALAAGGSLEEAAQIANQAAGIVVREVGTVAVSAAELHEKIQARGA